MILCSALNTCSSYSTAYSRLAILLGPPVGELSHFSLWLSGLLIQVFF